MLQNKDSLPDSELKKLEKEPLKNELERQTIKKKDTLKPLRAQL